MCCMAHLCGARGLLTAQQAHRPPPPRASTQTQRWNSSLCHPIRASRGRQPLVQAPRHQLAKGCRRVHAMGAKPRRRGAATASAARALCQPQPRPPSPRPRCGTMPQVPVPGLTTWGGPFPQAPDAQASDHDYKSLWNHLIRHVNRAHDELYVMCEAESSRRKCDEALALLSSAAEDFAEVRARMLDPLPPRASVCSPAHALATHPSGQRPAAGAAADANGLVLGGPVLRPGRASCVGSGCRAAGASARAARPQPAATHCPGGWQTRRPVRDAAPRRAPNAARACVGSAPHFGAVPVVGNRCRAPWPPALQGSPRAGV